MKEIILNRLTLRNFKGVKEFDLVLNGKSLIVKGDNKAGKTTLADAWSWLLTGKDTEGKEPLAFGIKTTTPDNEVIHHLEHVVEGELLVNGKKVVLKKVFKEEWTSDSTLKGHTTNYFFNGLNTRTKKEYDERVAEIVDTDILRLVTDPWYFCEVMHWEARRKVLIDAFGDVTDEEVLKSNKAFSPLKSRLEEHSIEDLETITKDRKKELNDERKFIEVRINEVNTTLPEVDFLDETQLNEEIKKLQADKDAKELERIRIQSGTEITQKEKQLVKIKSRLLALKNEHNQSIQEKIDQKQAEFDQLNRQATDIENKIISLNSRLNDNEETIARKTTTLEQLRNEWHEENNKEFDCGDNTCPTCNQTLPEEHIRQAEESFNLAKAKRLKTNQLTGKKTKAEVDVLKEINEQLQAKIEQLREDYKSIDLKAVKQKIESLKQRKGEVNSDEYQQKISEKESVKGELEVLKTDIEPSLETIKVEIANIEEKIKNVQENLNNITKYQEAQERIKTLMNREQELAKEIEDVDKTLYLINQFTRQKVRMVESQINSKFKLVKWQLFEEQVNGGIKEICSPSVDGVIWGRGLNRGSKVKAGLDTIVTLSEHFKTYVPIFIDDAEAVTVFPKFENQTIKLVKPEIDTVEKLEQYKQLVVSEDEGLLLKEVV